jgi:hypothetical protein
MLVNYGLFNYHVNHDIVLNLSLDFKLRHLTSLHLPSHFVLTTQRLFKVSDVWLFHKTSLK